MNFGPIGGIWSTPKGLVAAVIERDGPLLLTALLPDDESDRADWLSHVEAYHGCGLALVITDRPALRDPFGRLALELGRRVWIAPRSLAGVIARASWWRPRSAQIAAMLARFLLVPTLRQQLRLAPPDPGPRQLALFGQRRHLAPCTHSVPTDLASPEENS